VRRYVRGSDANRAACARRDQTGDTSPPPTPPLGPVGQEHPPRNPELGAGLIEGLGRTAGWMVPRLISASSERSRRNRSMTRSSVVPPGGVSANPPRDLLPTPKLWHGRRAAFAPPVLSPRSRRQRTGEAGARSHRPSIPRDVVRVARAVYDGRKCR
jgi:hypothetical protein